MTALNKVDFSGSPLNNYVVSKSYFTDGVDIKKTEELLSAFKKIPDESNTISGLEIFLNIKIQEPLEVKFLIDLLSEAEIESSGLWDPENFKTFMNTLKIRSSSAR